MYELRHLAALDAVATEGTFGRAAIRLGYTQSSLSQQIAALERAVGGAVFDRPGGPRPVQLTPLGRLVLSHARDLLQRSATTVAAVERFRAGDGRVDIGTFQTVTNVLLPPLVRRLREQHPGCDIRLFEDETDEPQLDDLDVMFFDAPGDADLDSRCLMEDAHVLVAPRGQFRVGPVQLDHLDGLVMVALPAICDQACVEQALAERDVAPRIVFRTADNQAVLSMVRAGLGCAVMPLLALEVRPDNELSLHSLKPALPWRGIYALTQGTLSPLAARAVDLAADVAAGLARPGVRPGARRGAAHTGPESAGPG